MIRLDLPRLSGNQRGFLLITIGTFALTGMNACFKALGGMSAAELMFVRGLGSALLLAAFACGLGLRRTLGTRRFGIHGSRILLGAAAGWGWAYATHHLSLALVTVLSLATPLWMLPLGRLLLDERGGAARWCGVLLGFAGVWVMAAPGGGDIGWPCIVAMAAALLDALLGILMKQATSTETDTGIMFWTMLGQALVFGILGGGTLPDMGQWQALAGLVVLSVLCGVLFAAGYRAGEVSAVEPACFNALPLAALVGYWRFGEVPAAAFWWGGLLLLAGVLLVLFGPVRWLPAAAPAKG